MESKIYKWLIAMLLILPLGFAFASCSDDDDDKSSLSAVVGTWEEGDSYWYMSITFKSDGTFTAYEENEYNGRHYTFSQTGTYSYSDSRLIVKTYSGDEVLPKGTYIARISGDMMEFIYLEDNGDYDTIGDFIRIK